MHKTFRVGFGYDVHRFEEGDSNDAFVMLCGISVPHTRGLVAHSDGDAAIHALVDAILGAACIDGASDIGEIFPPSDVRWKGCDSCYFLSYVLELIRGHGFFVNNVDITIVCQTPKISLYKDEMRKKLAEILEVNISQVNIKATTTEKLGFEGRSEGISAYAVASLVAI